MYCIVLFSCLFQAASSWCNIARVLEATGKDGSAVMDAYRNGIRLAEQSDNPMTIVGLN